jgi:hypothetical protein
MDYGLNDWPGDLQFKFKIVEPKDTRPESTPGKVFLSEAPLLEFDITKFIFTGKQEAQEAFCTNSAFY